MTSCAEYQEELSFHLTAKGGLLTLGTQLKVLVMIRGFTRFLKEREYLLHHPGEAIKLPRKPQRLPKAILSEKDMRSLLNARDMRTNKGYRDRLILEILYDTGIRCAEMSNMKIRDIDLGAGCVLVHGKAIRKGLCL